jgi:hypothetical protein
MEFGNIASILSTLRQLPDPQLQQFAAMHKNDPFLLPLAIQEDTARKQMRMAAQARATGAEQPKVVDQAVASIGQMPMPQMPMPQGGPMPQGRPMPPQGGPMPPQRGPQINMPPQDPRLAGLPTLKTGMATMADGGIAGYPDEEEIGMAEGGVARYNGQDESRVRQDVQFARDQESIRMLLAELQKEQAKAAQGDQRAQGDVEAIQGELRRHIKRNPPLAQMLTSAMPMAAAQAAPAAAQPAAAMPTPAGQIPTTTPGMQAPPAVPEGFFSRLGSQLGMSEEAKRNVGNILMAPTPMGVVTAPAKVPGQATGLEKLHEGVRRFFSPPSTARKFTPEELKAIQQTRAGEQAAQAAEDAAEAARMAGALPGEAQTAAAGVQATQAARQAFATPSAAERVQLLNQAQRAREAARVVQPVSPSVAGAQTAKQLAAAGAMATPAPVAPEAPPVVSDAPYRQEGLNYPPRKEDLSKEQKKDVIDAAKAATPKAERKGLTNDDYLVMGLTMMANPGRGRGLQGLLEAVGTGGMAAVQSRREREKSEREAAKEASEAEYRKAHAGYYTAQAKFLNEEKADLALRQKAATLAQDEYTKWLKTPAGMIATPPEQEAYRQKLVTDYYKQFALELPAGVSSGGGMPAIPEGVKVRQVG